VLAGGVSLWAVSPHAVFPPAVFGGCPPRFFCHAWLLPFILMSAVFSGVSAPGRPPGQQQDSRASMRQSAALRFFLAAADHSLSAAV